MKRVFLTSLAAMVILSGCMGLNPGNMTMPEESSEISIIDEQEVVSEIEQQAVELNLDYLDEVARIEITDNVEGEYIGEFYIVLTEEEVNALKEIKDCIKSDPEPWSIKENRYYDCKMNMYDKDGNLVDCWRCDFLFLIADEEGQILEIKDELDDWLDDVKEAHDLYSAKFSRIPGENYFAEIRNAEKGSGIENYLPNGSNDYISFSLDEEDIRTLRELADTMYVLEEPHTPINDLDDIYEELKYDISIYTDTDESYCFYVMADGTIYVQPDNCYEVVGEGVEEWFRTIEAKYGLDKI